MSYPLGTYKICCLTTLNQSGHTTGAFYSMQLAIRRKDLETCGIIASIFQRSKTLK
jgi:hypothetical protein